MDLRSERDVLDRQRIARQNIRVLAAQDHRVNLEAERGDDVTLLAVQINNQGDVRRAVRIVFDLGNTSRDTGLIAFEIDNAVMAFMAPTAAADRYTPVVVAS